MTPRIAVIVKGYPRLSETFIAQELLGLQERGVGFDIWSLRHPTDIKEHPAHKAITAPRRYLPEYLRREPLRVLRGVASQVLKRGFWRAACVWVRDLVRARDLNRIRRFGQAAVLARELPEDVTFLYAHFLHTPASVTRYAAMMRGLDWGVSAHAKDIWTSPDWEIREKLDDCAFAVTCTGIGADHLKSLAPPDAPERVGLVYHGLDLSVLPAPPETRSAPEPLVIMSVGRLVEKKGYAVLLDALAGLPEGLDWRFVHIGGGELKGVLREQAEQLGLAERIDWRGAQSREAVFEAMRAAHLFVLPSRIADSGDRDGLPNVLMEAASQKLPVISTSVSAIPEFIDTGRSGVLIPPDDSAALTEALAGLAGDAARRAAYAEALYARLVADFGSDAGIEAVLSRMAPYLSQS